MSKAFKKLVSVSLKSHFKSSGSNTQQGTHAKPSPLVQLLSRVKLKVFTKESVLSLRRNFLIDLAAERARAEQLLGDFECIRVSLWNAKRPLLMFALFFFSVLAAFTWISTAVALIVSCFVDVTVPDWLIYPTIGVPILSAGLIGYHYKFASLQHEQTLKGRQPILEGCALVTALYYISCGVLYLNYREQSLRPDVVLLIISLTFAGTLPSFGADLVNVLKALVLPQTRAEARIKLLSENVKKFPKVTWRKTTSLCDAYMPQIVLALVLKLRTIEPALDFTVHFVVPTGNDDVEHLKCSFLEVSGSDTTERYFLAAWNSIDYRIDCE